jgi:hypothetical protein
VNNEFKTEKELQNFLFEHIHEFIKNQFDDEVVKAYKEYDFNKQLRFGPRQRRVDIFVECKKFDYLIELKNPKYKTQNISAIGQVLNYSRKLSDSRKKMVIITTNFDEDTAKTINYYNLPITYIYFSKNLTLEYKGCV